MADLIQKYSLQQILELPKNQTPTVYLEQESEKSPLEILKTKKEQDEKQKMLKFTIKSIEKATLKEFDQKSAFYQSMHENKSFNRNPVNHRLYHALMEALIEDENAMDKGVANTIKDHKRKHDDDEDDDDEDPPAGPNQGKKTKRRRNKDSKSSKKPSTTKETPKGKAPSKGSKTGKSAPVKEPVEEPTAEVVMDDAGEDLVHDDDQPQDTFKPKTAKTSNPECLGSIKWSMLQRILSHSTTSWPLRLTSPSHSGYLTIATDYFFNNDLEYLKSSELERAYTASITKTKAAQRKHWHISQLNKFSKHNVYSTKKILGVKSVSVKKLHGYGHLEEIVVKRADLLLYMFKEGDLVDLHLNDIEDMLLLVVQYKLFHLTDSDIVEFIMALCMFTRSLVIKKRVDDLQLGVESYQKKLNITPPQQTFLEIEFKELYTPSHKPPGVIYEDFVKQKQVMLANELYKFSDETLKKVQDKLHHKVLDFDLGYNKEMSRRKWMATDKKRSKLMVELTDKQIWERRIIQTLERFVGALELEMDYKLMTRNV
ncbi:hypothetical protein Tco_1503946 [Tanacetum coccineum]